CGPSSNGSGSRVPLAGRSSIPSGARRAGHAPARAGRAWPAATARASPPVSRGARLRSSVADMLDLVAGIGAAVGASTLYSLGIALQALDAREAPHEEHLRLALARGLVRRGRWLFGTGLSILGWPLQIVALLLAPLVVVQPALAVGLLVLMFAGEHQHEQAHGQRRLHHDQRREQQRHDLKRPPQDREPGAEQPAPTPHQAPCEREAQVLLVRCLARVERLQSDP